MAKKKKTASTNLIEVQTDVRRNTQSTTQDEGDVFLTNTDKQMKIWDYLAGLDKQKTFAEPVMDDMAPNYSEAIKEPMDLGTIKQKIQAGNYERNDEMENDVKLMCMNAMRYNGKTTIFYRKAKQLMGQSALAFCGNIPKVMDTQSKEAAINTQRESNNYSRKGYEQEVVADLKLNGAVLDEAYNVIVTWRKNLFEIPTGKLGKNFVIHMKMCIDSWNQDLDNRSYALKALMVMPNLILQKPSKNVTSKQIKECMERRLKLWEDGCIEDLLREGNSLQERIRNSNFKKHKDDQLRKFNKFMMSGNVNSALRVLEEGSGNSGVLPLNDCVVKRLKEKHPPPEDLNDIMVLQGPSKFIDNVIYEEIDSSLIEKLAFRLKGASGPSGLDAKQWRKILGTKLYGNIGTDLCQSIATMAKKLASQIITDHESLEAFLACRLIPLEKPSDSSVEPGVRPIGIGEVLRRLCCKAVISAMKNEIQSSAGNLQLCAGQKGGIEAAIHSMVDMFNDEDSHGVIQVDAENGFNKINRNVWLKNLEILCPEIAVLGKNCYAKPARLFVEGGMEISSREGTTQGCPFSMPGYAIGILPLMSLIVGCDETHKVRQAAFADDLTGVGKLNQLLSWWKMIVHFGPYIGYYAKPSKSWLIVKEKYYNDLKYHMISPIPKLFLLSTDMIFFTPKI